MRRARHSTVSGWRSTGQRHAARPAAARAQLRAGDADDLDAGLLEAVVGLVVALVGDGDARCEGEGVVAVVPLLALGGDRVEAGVDLVQRVDLHRLGSGHQERLGRRRRARSRSVSSSPRSRTVTACAIRVSATLGYITTLSMSTIVQTVSRCMVARSCAIGTASTVWARSAWNTCRDSRSTPAGVVRSPTPTAMTPGESSRTSPPSTCSLCHPWIFWVCRRSAGARCRSARSAASRACGPASPAR